MEQISQNKARTSNMQKMTDAFKDTYGDKYTEVLFASLGLEMNRAYRQLEDSLADFSDDQ